MVIKLKWRFFLKNKPGLWTLIHAQDSSSGPDIVVRVYLPYIPAGEIVGRANAENIIFEWRNGDVLPSGNPRSQRLSQGLHAISKRVSPLVCMVENRSHDCLDES